MQVNGALEGCYMVRYTAVASLTPLLETQVSSLIKVLPVVFSPNESMGALLIGSCSRGQATYRSDLDILVILQTGSLTYSRVQSLRDQFEQCWSKSNAGPLPCQINFVLPTVFETSEPAMQNALRDAVILHDSGGTLDRKLEPFRRKQ